MEAARLLGAPLSRRIREIALPLARPAVAAGVALALMETLADFGVSSYFGIQTFTTGIYKAWLSMDKAGIGSLSYQVLISVLAVCLIPALVYLFRPTHKNGKNIEYASALWTLGLYLSLGGLQMILSLWR
jgi:ABC-type Fe3+ transport system permease subunit